MPETNALRSLEVDLDSNTLRLVVGEPVEGDEPQTSTETEVATIDIGTGGRLVGIELPDRYIDVMPAEPGTEHLIRSSHADVRVERAGEEPVTLIVPRLGAGYEIMYPSGNQ